MTANNLRDAFNIFDPRQPITQEQIDTLFVTRPDTQTRKMEADVNPAVRELLEREAPAAQGNDTHES